MQGTVKKLISHRGFGFIEMEGSDDDIFFHRSNCEEIFDSLEEGTAVEFDIEDTPKGPSAVNIALV